MSPHHEAADAFKRFLLDVLSEFHELGGGYKTNLDCFGRPLYTTLAGFYPPSGQLPGDAQKRWRDLESLIDEDRSPPERFGEWREIASAVDGLLLFVDSVLNPAPPSHDGYADLRRITWDHATQSVTLDGYIYAHLHPTQVRLIEAVVQAAESPPGYVTREVLAGSVYGKGGGAKSVYRVRESLPVVLREIVVGQQNRGYFLRLPPRAAC